MYAMSDPSRRRRAYKTATVLAIVLLVLAGAEIGLRAWRWSTLERNLKETVQPGDSVVLSLGESTAYGLYVPPGENYSRLVEDALNRRGDSRRYRVLNLAWPAAVSADILRCLEAALREYRPLFVLVSAGNNDFSYQMNYRARGERPPEDQSDLPFAFDGNTRPRKIRGSMLLHMLRRLLAGSSARKPSRRIDEPWRLFVDREGNQRLVLDDREQRVPGWWSERKPGIRAYLEANLRAMRDICLSRGVPMVLVGYIDSVSNKTISETARLLDVPFVDNRILSAVLRQEHVVWVSPVGMPDMFHPNARGHRWMATNILDVLRDRRIPD